ncbi:18388_t:CDS:2 [Funneliformis geosporum]|nr:18388_t:CDS:2 [Funneliformis geosporum]
MPEVSPANVPDSDIAQPKHHTPVCEANVIDNQLDCNFSKNDSSGDDDFIVPSEQVVERDLMQQLSLPSTSIDTEIPLTPPVIDKKQQFSVTAECIVYMFRKAVRFGYEEILHWYGFAESYDKRINEIRTINKVKINTAKQQVYQEVKKLLPDISDVNLRQQLSRARKLYKLFNAVGVEKIKQVTYSANAISNLNNTQIQNIIDYVLSKVIAGDHQNPKNNQVNASEAKLRFS